MSTAAAHAVATDKEKEKRERREKRNRDKREEKQRKKEEDDKAKKQKTTKTTPSSTPLSKQDDGPSVLLDRKLCLERLKHVSCEPMRRSWQMKMPLCLEQRLPLTLVR